MEKIQAYITIYFRPLKPTEANQKNRSLLIDSVYVKAYGQAAFKKNKHLRTPWHYVLVGGVVIVAAIIIFIAPAMA